MADDINKKITIEVEAQTNKLQQNITSLNQIINELQANQKKLTESGNENAAVFDKTAEAIGKYLKQLDALNKQLSSYSKEINSSGTSLEKNQALVDALAKTNEKLSKSIADSSSRLSELDKNIKAATSSADGHKKKVAEARAALDAGSKSLADAALQATDFKAVLAELNQALQQQKKEVDGNKEAFDAHEKTMDHLKKSFDEIKDVSGIFGPSLQEAAKGFDLMKSGLTLVEDGLKGVGTAIKADGFDFLLQILQSIFDYFIHTSKGSKMLKGAISAIGVVVNKVTGIFHALMDVIIQAFSHPVDTLKSLGRMIEQNLINRFKAFGVILDGIIHLDFKKVANGAIQAATGITDATDKMEKGWKAVKEGVVNTAKEMETAYNKGYNMAGQRIDQNEKKHKTANENKLKSDTDYWNKRKRLEEQQGADSPGGPLLEQGKSAGLEPMSDANLSTTGIEVKALKVTQDLETKKTEIKKTAIQKAEDYAKKSANKLAAEGLAILTNSIKQQSEAKIAALEKDKALELSNKSLTSAQKQAIEDKYKKKEQQVKAKAFKEQQEISIAQAIINGAIAITKTEADLGPIAGTIAIAAIVANTASQIATISKQKPPAMAKGGYFKSDGQGSVLSGYSRTDDTNAFLRSGEAVVVSEAMRDPWARNLVSAINVAYGGRDFSVPNISRGYAVGGIFTDGGNANRYYNQPVNDQKNLANTVAYQMVNNFPPVYVDVKDINNQQNILAQTINRVNL
ncbi:MAG TPA: hypothetical protein VL442_20035 [Mucilaginibacter sp.]|nr:hypothetical protein [Mucilaginibacter sp.]